MAVISYSDASSFGYTMADRASNATNSTITTSATRSGTNASSTYTATSEQASSGTVNTNELAVVGGIFLTVVGVFILVALLFTLYDFHQAKKRGLTMTQYRNMSKEKRKETLQVKKSEMTQKRADKEHERIRKAQSEAERIRGAYA